MAKWQQCENVKGVVRTHLSPESTAPVGFTELYRALQSSSSLAVCLTTVFTITALMAGFSAAVFNG